jgi:hypothetical protein
MNQYATNSFMLCLLKNRILLMFPTQHNVKVRSLRPTNLPEIRLNIPIFHCLKVSF